MNLAPPQDPTQAQTQDLTTGWRVRRADGAQDVPLNVPGDVHSALLRAGAIPDPYWRDTEVSLDWVHEADWIATTTFAFTDDPARHHTLTFDSVDCHAEIHLNGQHIGTCDNQFRRWDFATGDALQQGPNTLEVRFASASRRAVHGAANAPFVVPYLSFNNRLPHYNHLRKTQCHAGWDWNIALSPLGLPGGVTLRRTDPLRLDDITVRQTHADGTVTVEVEARFDAHTPRHHADAHGAVRAQRHPGGHVLPRHRHRRAVGHAGRPRPVVARRPRRSGAARS